MDDLLDYAVRYIEAKKVYDRLSKTASSYYCQDYRDRVDELKELFAAKFASEVRAIVLTML